MLIVAVPYIKKLNGPKISIVDNLSSHLFFDAIKACNKIITKFALLLPNSTHMIQPFDVAYFRPVKIA